MLGNEDTELKGEAPKLYPDSYESWRSNSTPDNLYKVVKDMAPTINYALSNLGAMGDPALEGEASLVAAKAIRKYDPDQGTKLSTYMTHQLQQMNRIARKLREPLRIPERQQMERHALFNSEMEFTEKYGREPSTAELADFTNIHIDKIGKLRRLPYTVRTQEYTRGTEDAEGDPASPIVDKLDFMDEAIDYVYLNSQPLDQRVFELMTGYAGSELLTPKEVAERLDISRSQVSRRFARMVSDLQDIEGRLNKVYG